jgi:parallel beta-helix repeat protein
MKKVLILCFCFTLHSFLHATNYYIASSGNDASDGKSIATAFASITQINQVVLQPGDSILFNRGDIFRGMLTIQQSGSVANSIYVGAYGSGNLPIISGAEVLTGWTNTSGNIFEATCTDCAEQIQQVFVNNTRHIPARYPNAGYLSMTNVDNARKTFTATDLNQTAGLWNGATIYLRTEQWVIDAFVVQTFSPQRINYSIPAKFYTSYDIQNYFGFFLSNTLIALDSVGEWFYDPSMKLISIVPIDATALSSNGAEVSLYTNCIRFSSCIKFVTIENIQMEKSLKDAVFLNQSSNVRIHSCTILQAGRDGIGGFEDYSTYNSTLTIDNCFIRDICNTGVNLIGGDHILVKGNTLQSIGLIPGLGQGYDAGYDGIYCPSNSKVIGNTLDSIGYNGIHVNQYDTVMYNQCSNFGRTKNDCGGIYYWTGLNNYIGYNIVHDGYGNAEGTTFPNRMMVSGIYSDDYSHDNVIEYNTTYQNETGIMIHNTANTRVQYNTMYDNRREQLYLIEGNSDLYSVTLDIHNNQIRNNVLQCVHPSQTALLIESSKNHVATFGTFSDNWYCNPYSSNVITVAYTPLYTNANYTMRYTALTMQQWQSIYSQDLSSHTAYDYPSVYASYSNIGNDLILNSTFSSGIGWWWTYGNPQFTLNAVPAGPHINSISLNGQYQNKQTLSEGNWGIASIPLVKDKNYFLRYKIVGEQMGGVKIGMNFQDAPSTPSTTPVSLCRSYSTNLKQDSILFLSNYTSMNSLVFKSTSFDGDFWLDDVTLFEVTVDTVNAFPHTSSKLFVNKTNTPLTLASANNYRNLDGTIVTNNIILQPYTSVVLKNVSITTGVSTKAKASIEIKLFPNPASDKLYIAADDLLSKPMIHIFNLLGEELYYAPYSEYIQLPEEWANGLYLLELSNENGSAIKRFALTR